jgi:hypothetical protein
LWDDLTRGAERFESPEWHHGELIATEGRVESGQEQFVDWESAKKKLRKPRETGFVEIGD